MISSAFYSLLLPRESRNAFHRGRGRFRSALQPPAEAEGPLRSAGLSKTPNRIPLPPKNHPPGGSLSFRSFLCRQKDHKKSGLLNKQRACIIKMKELIGLPELSRFYNIAIKMIYSDSEQHHKPHFHVYFAEYTASVGVDGELLAGQPSCQVIKTGAGLGRHSRRRTVSGMEQSGSE